MIIWINGAFGAGKTRTANELSRRVVNSFIYDPENIGYFFRKNTPKQIQKNDFQDSVLWRELNYSLLRSRYEEYDGTIIVPMTVVNRQYFSEIVVRLQEDGVEVKHFALCASKDTLLKRLRSRGNGKNSWAAAQIDRCIECLSHEVFGVHLETDHMTVEENVERIAELASVDLLPDDRGKLKKKMDRYITQIKHIRGL